MESALYHRDRDSNQRSQQRGLAHSRLAETHIPELQNLTLFPVAFSTSSSISFLRSAIPATLRWSGKIKFI
jgi:hypothetical protein